jgi:hypothetical protein
MAQEQDDQKKGIEVNDLEPKKDAKGGAARTQNLQGASNMDGRRSLDGGSSLDGSKSMDGGGNLDRGGNLS